MPISIAGVNKAFIASPRIWMNMECDVARGDAAGEAIYGAIFDAAPSLHSLFKTARSVASDTLRQKRVM